MFTTDCVNEPRTIQILLRICKASLHPDRISIRFSPHLLSRFILNWDLAFRFVCKSACRIIKLLQEIHYLCFGLSKFKIILFYTSFSCQNSLHLLFRWWSHLSVISFSMCAKISVKTRKFSDGFSFTHFFQKLPRKLKALSLWMICKRNLNETRSKNSVKLCLL